MLAVIAVPAGLLIGLSLGALGGGGSILTVPALVYLLHQQPHAATTGSLIIVGITALAGTAAHWRAGRVRVAQGVTFGALGIAGSYAGTKLSASIRPELLLVLFAGLMLAATAAMLRRRPHTAVRKTTAAAAVVPDVAPITLDRSAPAAPEQRPGTGGGRRADTTVARRALKIAAAATGVGLLTGFFGVGGGFVIVPALVLALGFEMPTAVGTSLLVISVNSAAALTARLGTDVHLDWALTGVFTLAALVGTLAGNHVASRVSASKLTAAFALLLVAVAAYTLARSLPALL